MKTSQKAMFLHVAVPSLGMLGPMLICTNMININITKVPCQNHNESSNDIPGNPQLQIHGKHIRRIDLTKFAG